jgi:hypothetical protein
MPKLPSPQSSKSSLSSAGVRGIGVFSFNVPVAFVGSSRSSPQSSSTTIFLVDFFFPRRFIDPPSSAEEGTLVGIGIPACFADVIALIVERLSSGVMRTCQSSSPVFDSDRTETRDDID